MSYHIRPYLPLVLLVIAVLCFISTIPPLIIAGWFVALASLSTAVSFVTTSQKQRWLKLILSLVLIVLYLIGGGLLLLQFVGVG